MKTTISFNYKKLILKKPQCLEFLKGWRIVDITLPKLGQTKHVNFASVNSSPIRGFTISKPTKEHQYEIAFICGEININPETNLPFLVPFFNSHLKWLTVIPGVWNDVKKNFDDFKVYYTNLDQNKNLSEMDILINSYSYSYMRATNKQGSYYVDPKERQLWLDNTNLPLESLLT
jgi:hypothetical protein